MTLPRIEIAGEKKQVPVIQEPWLMVRRLVQCPPGEETCELADLSLQPDQSMIAVENREHDDELLSSDFMFIETETEFDLWVRASRSMRAGS